MQHTSGCAFTCCLRASGSQNYPENSYYGAYLRAQELKQQRAAESVCCRAQATVQRRCPSASCSRASWPLARVPRAALLRLRLRSVAATSLRLPRQQSYPRWAVAAFPACCSWAVPTLPALQTGTDALRCTVCGRSQGTDSMAAGASVAACCTKNIAHLMKCRGAQPYQVLQTIMSHPRRHHAATVTGKTGALALLYTWQCGDGCVLLRTLHAMHCRQGAVRSQRLAHTLAQQVAWLTQPGCRAR